MELTIDVLENRESDINDWRLTNESLLPQKVNKGKKSNDGYDIYPYYSLGANKINNGYDSLVNWIIEQKNVVIDGYAGVFWKEIERILEKELHKRNLTVNWTYVSDAMKSKAEVKQLLKPFLGQPQSVWGKKCDLNITDFFQVDQLSQLLPANDFDINIAIGVGSALLNWDAPIIYLEVPKNEIQYRMRAGSVTNFGSDETGSVSEMYKHAYFVDWVLLNKHKRNILNKVAIVADVQWKDSLNWMFQADLLKGLKDISHSIFRARPWFAAGAWGGHWMQNRIKGLIKDEVNYAWSFELIVPENGIVFEGDGNLLEVSFDFLMFQQNTAVLGKHAEVFGTEFPIRFDFLDTFDGGNLSIQCHPSVPYIQKEFGENFTQDETYYILDCKDDALVYLGFQEDIKPDQFRKELEDSQKYSREIDIEKYVQTFPSKKHDFFLIPNGTVHSSGTNNLVLEISATPYIFTFKMYDWVRMGLDGKPRPINIEHAFKNLNFERKGDKVQEELISKPSVIDQGADWELIHLPTHQDHFYDLHRIEFDTQVTIDTQDACHILMLVEGTTISVQSADGKTSNFHYAETFIVPAAVKSYTITNTGGGKAKVVKAFVKDNVAFLRN